MVKIKACLDSELLPGMMSNINLQGRTVLIVNVDGQFFAIDGRCSGDGADLANGERRGFLVRCPTGGEEFDLRTGRVAYQPRGNAKKANDLRPYPVFLEKGCLYADIS
jgi:3-phenylpropionate/trans-cinnamate dioxygenase ferredoxin subunit